MGATMQAITLEAEAFKYIIDLIYERCRIWLYSGKESLIRARLGKLMRAQGFRTLAEYCDFLRTRADEDEFTRVVDALTTNFTSFLREEDHFQFLVSQAIPQVLPSGKRSFRAWSAACSSGEEPYTMAFYLSEHFPPSQGWQWQITASDISTKVLHAARQGVYTDERVRCIPPEWLRRYFQKGVGKWAGHYRIKPSLARHVEFHQINLIESYEHRHVYETIFCRNVMIYFDRATQEQLINQLCRFLVPRGYLLIGHSESLAGLRAPLRCLRPSLYQKV